MKKIILSIFIIGALASCSKDDDNNYAGKDHQHYADISGGASLGSLKSNTSNLTSKGDFVSTWPNSDFHTFNGLTEGNVPVVLSGGIADITGESTGKTFAFNSVVFGTYTVTAGGSAIGDLSPDFKPLGVSASIAHNSSEGVSDVAISLDTPSQLLITVDVTDNEGATVRNGDVADYPLTSATISGTTYLYAYVNPVDVNDYKLFITPLGGDEDQEFVIQDADTKLEVGKHYHYTFIPAGTDGSISGSITLEELVFPVVNDELYGN